MSALFLFDSSSSEPSSWAPLVSSNFDVFWNHLRRLLWAPPESQGPTRDSESIGLRWRSWYLHFSKDYSESCGLQTTLLEILLGYYCDEQEDFQKVAASHEGLSASRLSPGNTLPIHWCRVVT